MAALALPHQLETPMCTTSTINTKYNNKQCFFYELVITSAVPYSYFTIGKVKHEIDLPQLLAREDCYHNEAAYARKLQRDGWANNYTSPCSRKIFDCHFIEYNEECNGIEFHITILFFSLKAGELLIPSVINSDAQIVCIVRNHIMVDNNLTKPIYHDYRIELLCKEIAVGEILDLRYVGHPACKTQLFPYQRGSIQWAINLETEISDKKLQIYFTEHKVFFLEELDLVFDYNNKCFIKRDELPKVPVYGGIIADEVGLGKTVQALNIALSREGIRTLIIVPNHMKDHWMSEMQKHFVDNPFDGMVLVVTVAEASTMPDEVMNEYQRLIVDELAELYASGRPENNSLFARLCSNSRFQYRWGITATPFVDNGAMYNIIRFLLGNYKIYSSVVGNYTYIQDQFKTLFRRNIKANVQRDVKLPDVIIHNCGLTFSEHERAILAAMEMDSATFSINDRLRIISNAMLEMTNNDKSVITVEELRQLTVQRFHEKIVNAQVSLDELLTKQRNIESQLELVLSELSSNTQKDDDTTSTVSVSKFKSKDYYSTVIHEYEDRKRHLESEIEAARHILARRKQVHQSYLEMTQHIDEIIISAKKTMSNALGDSTDSTDDVIGDSSSEELDIDGMINENKMCPICYNPFSENIVLFIKCRHYFCQRCFEQCHMQRPNTCPMCRTLANIGEINYIGINSQIITSTKNSKILKLLNTHSQERFLIFTRFDKFITPLTSFLSLNDIAARTFDEYKASSQRVQDETRVILLSANSNASGTDMSFMHRVIIIEPFESYIYGKEIEKQLIGRLHRINQTYDVDVYRLYIQDTIEEQIYALG